MNTNPVNPINIEELNKLSQLVLNNVPVNHMPQQHIPQQHIPQQHVPQQPIHSLSNIKQVNHIQNDNELVNTQELVKYVNPEFYKIGGLAVPPQTLYLFFTLLVIGFMILKSGNKKT